MTRTETTETTETSSSASIQRRHWGDWVPFSERKRLAKATPGDDQGDDDLDGCEDDVPTGSPA